MKSDVKNNSTKKEKSLAQAFRNCIVCGNVCSYAGFTCSDNCTSILQERERRNRQEQESERVALEADSDLYE